VLKPAAGNTKVSALSKPLGDRKIIYHYTSAHALLQIFKSGFIKTTDSLLGLTGSTRIELHHETDERFPRIRVPYVVWLTDLTFFDTPHMLENHVHDKTEVRVVVGKTPEYIRADKWYKENGATDDGIKVLEETADSSTSTWYVLERGLLVDEFIRIEYVNINPKDISIRYWQELTTNFLLSNFVYKKLGRANVDDSDFVY
jgi:hypothetical protein